MQRSNSAGAASNSTGHSAGKFPPAGKSSSTDKSSSGGRSSAGSRSDQPFDCEQVHAAELGEIRTRRQQQGLDSHDPASNLVGLALSGGGLRSASLSLGVLQSLHRRGALRYVDYLSTVSGGGYAGAYLSSVALHSHPSELNQSPPHNAQTSLAITEKLAATVDAPSNVAMAKPVGEPTRPRLVSNAPDKLTIAAPANQPQPLRMIEFIYGGHYLRRNWTFINRYVIGLLQIWTVVFSGLLARAALTVWLFKSLDTVEWRNWLSALGFEGDIAVAFFPSFVLFGIWVVAWGISYFRSQGRACGRTAGWIFFAMILVTVTAVAALLGTGDLDVPSLAAAADGQPSNETLTAFSKTLQAVIFGAIAAAPLPYFRPKKLFNSGTSPHSKPVERYIFWFATRALVFGVPFLLISFFARENISDWNTLRTDAIEVSEIEDWNKLDPRAPHTDSRQQPIAKWWGATDTNILPIFRLLDFNPAGPISNAMWPADTISRIHTFKNWMQVTLREQELTRLFNLVDSQSWQLDQLDSPVNPPARETAIAEHTLGETKLPFWSRWRYQAEYFIYWLVGDDHDRKKNRIYEIADLRGKVRTTRENILSVLNDRLRDREFAVQFLSLSFFKEQLALLKDDKPRMEWLNRLRVAYDKALAIRTLTADRPSIENLPKQIKNLTETLSTLGPDQVEDDLISAVAREKTERQLLEANRALLAAYHDGAIKNKSKVFSSIVLAHDQRTRMTWFIWSGAIFICSGLLVSLNATSWHGFYAAQLSRMWIDPVDGLDREIPLPLLDTTKHGFPYHLISGSVQLLGRKRQAGHLVARDHFLFSKLFCGSDRLDGYRRTCEYMQGKLTLADATAMSGAAFTPLQTSNPLLQSLLILGNLRLGQWIDNPSQASNAHSRNRGLTQHLWVSPIRMMIQLFRKAEDRPFCFVTDGGHHENLGIEPLLKRRCRLIIASDAGEDGQHTFADFAKLLNRMHMEEGITFVPLEDPQGMLRLNGLIPSASNRFTNEHFLVAEIRYPVNEQRPTSYLIYFKSSLTGDEPAELLQYRDANPSFPHDPTADQFYSPERFAAYVQLGVHLGEKICRHLPEAAENLPVETFITTIVGKHRRELTSSIEVLSTSTDNAATAGVVPCLNLEQSGLHLGQDGSVATSAWSPASPPPVNDAALVALRKEIAEISIAIAQIPEPVRARHEYLSTSDREVIDRMESLRTNIANHTFYETSSRELHHEVERLRDSVHELSFSIAMLLKAEGSAVPEGGNGTPATNNDTQTAATNVNIPVPPTAKNGKGKSAASRRSKSANGAMS